MRRGSKKRAAESSYGTVYCCPGALTAYRLSAVREVFPKWINQQFLGVTCTFGEDRALTNDLLAAGFDAVYQSSATVHTVVPSRYAKLCKMFLRWNRSYVREELRLMRIVWSRPPASRVLTLYDRFVSNLQFPVGYIGLAILITTVIANPAMIPRYLASMGFVSVLTSIYALRSESSALSVAYGVLFSFFSTFAMSWILPYAFLTVRARSWLTR